MEMMKLNHSNKLLLLLSVTFVGVALGVVHPDGVSKVTHYQDELGNYQFGYTVSSVDGEHFHRSDKDAEGRIVGSYGLTGTDGRQRVVDYVADHTGFRAHIRSNEPGLASAQSSALTIQKSGPAEIVRNPPLDFAASNNSPAGPDVAVARSDQTANEPNGPVRRITHLSYAAKEPDTKETENARLDYAASDPSSRRLGNYGDRIKETTSKVVYARPYEEEQYRRRLPISSSGSLDDREDGSKIDDSPWTSRFTSNNRRRLSQRQNSDSFGSNAEIEDSYVDGGFSGAYRPPLDPFSVRRPLITSRATSIARPLQIFTPQPSTPPYGGFESKDPFFLNTDNPISNRYPGIRSNDEAPYPGISMYTIHGGLGNMFPLLPQPPPLPGVVRDPVIGLPPPELVLQELMALDGQRVPGHPDLVFKVISAQNGIQVVPVDPLTGQAQNVPLVPHYDPQNGERRAILDRDKNFDFKFGDFDSPGLRRPFRTFDREPGSSEGSARSTFDRSNRDRTIQQTLGDTFSRRPSSQGSRATGGGGADFDDDFLVPSRFGSSVPLSRTNKGTRYDPNFGRYPIEEPAAYLNSRGYRSIENARTDESADDSESAAASENAKASTASTT